MVAMQPHEEQIWQLAEPLLASEGMELVQVECLKMKSRWLVRIYMDREEGGVTLDDCALISNQLGDLLDVHDVPPGPYTLEVSSPGLDRPLASGQGFSEVSGLADQPPSGGKDRGTAQFLRGAASIMRMRTDGKVLVVEVDGKTFRIPREAVVKGQS